MNGSERGCFNFFFGVSINYFPLFDCRNNFDNFNLINTQICPFTHLLLVS